MTAPDRSPRAAEPRLVHNHGIDPSCRERIVDGHLVGECLVPIPAPRAAEGEASAKYPGLAHAAKLTALREASAPTCKGDGRGGTVSEHPTDPDFLPRLVRLARAGKPIFDDEAQQVVEHLEDRLRRLRELATAVVMQAEHDRTELSTALAAAVAKMDEGLLAESRERVKTLPSPSTHQRTEP